MSPHDSGLEEAILGCLMDDNECFNIVEPYLQLKDVWYTTKHQMLYEKMCGMRKAGQVVDLVTINASLTAYEKETIDAYWLSGLKKDIGMGKYRVEEYSKQLYHKYLLRRTIEVVRDIQDKAYDCNEDVYDTMASAHSIMGELIELRPTMNFDMDKTIDDAKKAIDNGELS